MPVDEIVIAWYPIAGADFQEAHDDELNIQVSLLRVLRAMCQRDKNPFLYADLFADTVAELNRRMDLDSIPF